MKLDRLISFFSSNPSAKLLRSPNAAHIIFFLNRHYKSEGNLATPHSELQQHLSQYLEDIHETYPEILRELAEKYLGQWSTGDSRWLHRYFDREHSEPVYQLTPHTEDVLKFLTEILDRTLGFVGTESRLTRIIETLSDISVRGSDDRDRRLQHLYAERDRIDLDIQSVEDGDAISTHSPTAIRERFADVVSDLISLQGDFRAVEESFKTITRDVQKQQTESSDTRGNILGTALDAEDQLKEDDQGASFQAFVRLILSQSQQTRLEKIILQLDGITELASQWDGKEHVKGMIGSLAAEAEKVMRTMRRLSSTLRRLLDTKASTSRQRLASVLRKILSAAVRRAENPPNIGIDIHTELDLLNVSQRTFWQSPVEFDEVELTLDEPDEDDRMECFKDFARMQHLDWDAMRSNIASLVQSTERVTLPELLDTHPLSCGSMEVLGYIQLAHDGGHEVDSNRKSVVYLENGDFSQPYEVPRVVFLSERLRSLCAHAHSESEKS